jgi:CheY-like chemotaxis protein
VKDAHGKSALRHSSEPRGPHERSLSARLLEVQDQERRRISRELHDSVGQSLVAVKMNLGMVKRKLAATELKALEDVERMIDEVVTEVRTVSHLLHPPTLDLMGLRSAIISCAEGLQQRSGIDVSLDVPEILPDLNRNAQTALFRVVQECLTNVHRHANASSIKVQVRVTADALQLAVKDDGVGIRKLDRHSEGIGILGMRERLKELSGTLRVESTPGAGTTMLAFIPLNKNSAGNGATRESEPLTLSSTPSRGARILLVDDHELMRRGVRSLLETQTDFEVSGEASSSQEALEQLERLRPDVVVLDLQMPDASGWSVVRGLRKMNLATRVIIFSHFDQSFVRQAARNAGCHGNVSKARAADDLVNAIRAVLAGTTFFRTDD